MRRELVHIKARRLLKLGLESNGRGRSVHDTQIQSTPLEETRYENRKLLDMCIRMGHEGLRRAELHTGLRDRSAIRHL